MGELDPLDAARRAKFSRVFDLSYEPMQRYVRRRGGGSDTDDVVAEALAVVWRRLDELPADAELPWCLGVARRCLANQRRASQRRLNLVRRLASQPDISSPPSIDPDVDAALAALDDDQREILRLSAWEGLGASEIAVVLGISPNAASIRLHRARKELADAFEARKKSSVEGHSSVEAAQRKEER